MITNMTFGECLKYMLSALDISINRFAKAINVDSSLVNRWIHGTRIPAYHAPYIEIIAEYLSKNILNSFQVQHLNELYLNVLETHALIDCNKKKIGMILLEAQGYSIELKKKERKKNRDCSSNKEKISKIFNNYQYDIIDGVYASNESYASEVPNLTDCIPLTSDDKIIFGAKNIISYSVSLLEAALKKKCNSNKKIYITYSNELDVEYNSCDELVLLKELLLKALNNEWNVLILLRYNNSIDRTLRFINFILPLLQTGRLDIYYFKKYDTSTTDREIYAISEIGALSYITAGLHSKISCAFYFENKYAVDVLKDCFNVILANFSQPLIKYFSQEKICDYNRCIMENEESKGNRFLFKYFFSMSMLPEDLYERLLKRKNISKEERLEKLNFCKRRLNAFLLNIQDFVYRDIYFADSILNMVEHRQYCYYSDTGMEIINLEAHDIIDYLQNIIRLLETYVNYSIAFIPRNPDSTVKIDNYHFLVKERQSVLLRVYEPLKSMPEVRLYIDEPMFVQAFEEYFKGIWDHIAPVYKDKKETITWLQRQIDLLNKSLPDQLL